MKHMIPFALCALLAAGCEKAATTPSKSDTRKDADNTARNLRDREGTAPTPMDQSANEADTKRTAEIRKRVVDAKLSTNAENVKIITQNGRVTVRGPVKSQAEKDTILRIAREIAGDGNVEDLIEVEIVR